MSVDNYQNILCNGRKIIDDFISSNKYYFSELKPSVIPDKMAGVYAIFNSTETLYVGRSKNLRQRLYNNHLMGPLTNARLKKYLIEDNESFPQITSLAEAKDYIKSDCYVQFLYIDSIVKRGQIEGLLSFVLNVKYLHEEH